MLTQVNQALVLTYWQIGKTIKQNIVTEARAAYGDATMQKFADRLLRDYGAGFGRHNLFRMVKLYQCFGELSIVTTLPAQLSWSHLVERLKVDDPTKRAFYTDLRAQSRWSVRTLRERMDGMLFERTAIAKQPEAVIRQALAQLGQAGQASPALLLKDPYLLDFLDLKDGFTEKDLENAILAELERFILELGSDFAFMGNTRVRILVAPPEPIPEDLVRWCVQDLQRSMLSKRLSHRIRQRLQQVVQRRAGFGLNEDHGRHAWGHPGGQDIL